MTVTVLHLSFKKCACNVDNQAYTRVFVLKRSAAAKSGYGGRFYSTLGRRYLLSDTPKKILKSDSNIQSYSKCYRGTLFDLQFHVHDALSGFTRQCSNIIQVRWQIQFRVCVQRRHSHNSERMIKIDSRLTSCARNKKGILLMTHSVVYLTAPKFEFSAANIGGAR